MAQLFRVLPFTQLLPFVLCFQLFVSQAAFTSPSYRIFRRPTTFVSSSPIGTEAPIWNEDKVYEFALNQGINITFSTLGPGYRALSRSTHNSSLIMGYCEGFVRPTGNLLHLDKMEVYKKQILRIRKENDQFVNGGTAFGPGLLMGFLCLLHGKENGCKVAEFLAIDDEDNQHKKLVKYYKRSGFKIIKYVGEDIRDIPDRMLWGGCGTLMREDIDVLLESWTAILVRATEKLNK